MSSEMLALMKDGRVEEVFRRSMIPRVGSRALGPKGRPGLCGVAGWAGVSHR